MSYRNALRRLAAVGLSIGAIALVAAPVAAIWAGLGWALGGKQEDRRRQGWDTGKAPAGAAAAAEGAGGG